MRYTKNHTQYTLLDCSNGQRLEDWNGVILVRPDPQVVWNTPLRDPRWNNPDGRYLRSASGGGSWEKGNKLPQVWQMSYGDLKFYLKPMGFKHTGVFAEQAVNWDMFDKIITSAIADEPQKDFSVLNLFAYTGGATLACLNAGAEVVHVDAAKGMVAWGRENAELSGLADRKCRWIVDDCMKFVARQLRRGCRYRGIIMDPPSYGRGPNGEVWKLEDTLYELICQCAGLLADDAEFFAVNSYTTGLSASTTGYMLGEQIIPLRGGRVMSDEIGLPVHSSGLILPCGATSVWYSGRYPIQ